MLYAYNLKGRLTTLTSAAGTSSYERNGPGQRTAKTVAGVTTRYACDKAGHLLDEYAASGNARKEYVRLADTPVPNLANAAEQRIVDISDTPRKAPRLQRLANHVQVVRLDANSRINPHPCPLPACGKVAKGKS